MITKTTYFEEYEIGHTRETFGRTITEADILTHAGQTSDFYPHHMDKEWCATQPFKRRMAHGTLILSVGVGMTAGDINPVAMSYGYDRVRFVKPVHIGDTLYTRATITEKRDHKKPEFGILVEKLEVTNQNKDTVLVCEHIYFVERKSPLKSN